MKGEAAPAEHGTMARYRRGCRCDLCRGAKAAARLPQEREELATLLADPADPRHGTTTGYRVGCRCERCKAANEKEAFKYAAAKIMQGGEEEILVRTEILLDAAGPSERSER